MLTRIRLAALLSAGVAALALSSCSTTTEDHASHPSSAAAESVAAHNNDDVLFAQLMIPHHQQAVELAGMVPDRSTNPDLLKLAAGISAAQQPQTDTMKALLVRWDVNPAEAQHESGHAGLTMQGMVDDTTVLKLRGLKGADFDALWLQSMIDHHRGAVEMANTEIADGKNPDMITLAKNIVTAQQAEIDQMKQMAGG